MLILQAVLLLLITVNAAQVRAPGCMAIWKTIATARGTTQCGALD